MSEAIEKQETNLLEELEKEQESILRERGLLESDEGVEVKKIKDNVFSVESEKTENISFFIDKNGNELLSVVNITSEDNVLYRKASLLSGYWEIENENGKYEMYEIDKMNIKVQTDKGDYKNINTEEMLTKYGYSEIKEMLENNKVKLTPELSSEPVDKYSEEYYNAWKDIEFFTLKLLLESLKLPYKGEFHNIPKKLLEVDIKTGDIRIKDLVKFYEQGQLEGGKETFNKLLPKVRELLIEQIGDDRLNKFGDPVTKEELDMYLEEGYISTEYYIECMEMMEEEGRIDKKILKELKQEMEPELNNLKEEVNGK